MGVRLTGVQAEQTGAAILAETEAEAVAAHGVDMTLWVSGGSALPVWDACAGCLCVPVCPPACTLAACELLKLLRLRAGCAWAACRRADVANM